MFEPGHLHIVRQPLQPDDWGCAIDIRYAVGTEAGVGQVVHFDMEGAINERPFKASFELTGDLAYNFASNAQRIALNHGMPEGETLPINAHPQYDAMFEDIRHQLGAHSGDPVAPEHLPDR